MKLYKFISKFLLISFMISVPFFSSQAQYSHMTSKGLDMENATIRKPLTTDSRIKTYVYSEDEIFMLLLHYGYQSSIEFSRGEEIQTISVGDSYAWDINAIGRRLFIRPLEENIKTNLTIITNKRSYQFDLLSKLPDENIDRDLVYVVRFYYPKKQELR